MAKEKYFGSAAEPLEKIFWFGGEAGVAFFFVLSGFIIYHVHHQDFERPKRLANYIRKRAIRIYPTYIIIFLSVYFAAKATPSLQNTIPSDPILLLKSLLLLPQDSKVVGGTGAPVIIAAWSLQYEMVFYAIFSLALIKRWAFFTAAIVLVANLMLEPIFGPYDFPRNFLASHLILLFGLGMLAGAALKSNIQSAHNGWLAVLSVLAFATVAVFATLNRESYQKPLYDLCYGIASASLIFSLARFEKESPKMPNVKRLSIFGDASYALYLLHFPLIAVLSKIAASTLPINALGVGAAFLLLVGGSITTAVAFNLVVERPIIRRLTLKPSLHRNDFASH